MNTGFKTILITAPETVENEFERLIAILQSGAFDYIHVRKPDMTVDEMRSYISAIPEKFHHQFRLHSNFALVKEFNVAGMHLNSRNHDISGLEVGRGALSKSCHSLDEISETLDKDIDNRYGYVFLSPIFDSISKTGYASKFNLETLKGKLSVRVMALGGCRPESFGLLSEAGFAGCALLGYVWNSDIPVSDICREVLKCKNDIK